MRRAPSGSPDSAALVERYVGDAYETVKSVSEKLPELEAIAENITDLLASGPNYEHTQSSISDLWLVNHNLGFYPAVQVFSPGGLEVETSVQHLNNNQTEIRLSVAMSGFAVFR